eukprot:8511342-Alexandrium_andersonii.AAC.1
MCIRDRSSSSGPAPLLRQSWGGQRLHRRWSPAPVNIARVFPEAAAPARGPGLQGVRDFISGATWLGLGPRVFSIPTEDNGLRAVPEGWLGLEESELYAPAPSDAEGRSRACARPSFHPQGRDAKIWAPAYDYNEREISRRPPWSFRP